MVRLVNILKKQEKERTFFDTDKPAPADTQTSASGMKSAKDLYKGLQAIMRSMLLDVLNDRKIALEPVSQGVDSLIKLALKDDPELLRMTEEYDDSEDYLVLHSVNVCILSLEIAKGLGYDEAQMRDLGLGAMLHDVGMLKAKNILENRRRLYYAEYEEIKNHPDYGLQILKDSSGINERVLNIISQHHERSDGSGYLNGLAQDKIDEYARIVGLADVYEALVHSRPHRNKLTPFEYETIEEIISNRNMFDPYILRVFLERLTKQPAYMLWMATGGIYEILNLQKKIAKDTEVKPQVEPGIKPQARHKHILLATSLTVILLGLGLAALLRGLAPGKEVFYPLGSRVGIAENRLPLKIAYDFKKDTLQAPSASLDLAGINLDGFYYLSFSARVDSRDRGKTNYATLKISVTNDRKETATYYVQDITTRWREFRVPLSYFDAVRDWSKVNDLSFVLQPWNIDSRQGEVYVDDIYFFRKR